MKATLPQKVSLENLDPLDSSCCSVGDLRRLTEAASLESLIITHKAAFCNQKKMQFQARGWFAGSWAETERSEPTTVREVNGTACDNAALAGH